MAAHLTHILVALATAFLVALFAGRLVARFHLPRVTGYLLSGLVAGPAVAEAFGVPALLDRVSLTEMQLLSDIALALMMFTIGAQFRAERLRRACLGWSAKMTSWPLFAS
jgi:Kef-type K+ transport system membrane component KefB